MQDQKANEDRRRDDRFNSLNLLDYTAFDEENNATARGMGRTLNVSKSGICLETTIAFKPGQMIKVAVGLGENVAEISGRIVHSEMTRGNRYTAGIEFHDMDDKSRQALDSYLELFQQMQD